MPKLEPQSTGDAPKMHGPSKAGMPLQMHFQGMHSCLAKGAEVSGQQPHSVYNAIYPGSSGNLVNVIERDCPKLGFGSSLLFWQGKRGCISAQENRVVHAHDLPSSNLLQSPWLLSIHVQDVLVIHV